MTITANLAAPIALTNCRIIGTAEGTVLERGYVLIEGRFITRVAPMSELQLPSQVETFDLRGSTLMPGLIDAHVHLLANAAERRQDIHLWNVTTFIEEQTLHAGRNAEIALESGVTTVRDMAGSRPEVAVKHAVDDFVIRGSRVVASGFVGMTAGHGDMFCPPAIDRRLWKTADGPSACRQLVREYARDGVDFIKICTSGGVLSQGDRPNWRNYSPEETAVIVDEAHALGMKVAAHAHTAEGIKQALGAGVNTIEHGSQLTDELAAEMASQGTWLCPTLTLATYILEHGEARGVPAESLRKGAETHKSLIEGVRRAHKEGVRIVVGTDSCNTMAFGNHAKELELLQKTLNLTGAETIAMATQSTADAIGLGERVGSVAPGRWADLLVVDGDPQADCRLLQDRRRILLVVRDGAILVSRRDGTDSRREMESEGQPPALDRVIRRDVRGTCGES
jgi:imidazolonepropionase-like amidohydrolase